MRRSCCRRSFLLYFSFVLSIFYCLFRLSGIGNQPLPDHPARPVSNGSFSRALENACKYPILHPNDPNLKPYIEHGQRLKCAPTQDEFVTLDDDFMLTIDQSMAKSEFDQHLDCYYRPIAGGVQPRIRDIKPLRNWTKIEPGPSSNDAAGSADRYSVKVDDDIVEVRCYLANQTDVENLLKAPPRTGTSEIVFHYAFAQIGRPVRAAPVEDETRKPPHKYGVDILVLDSTSLNMFRRHAPSSWEYMKKKMGFYHLDGYMKVGDNSLVNLIPLLTGLRYRDSGDGGPSDLPVDKPLDSDEVPLLWRLFKAAGCATMFNDDIAVPSRGFWSYPSQWTPGFHTQPTDHFYRPWNLYHRDYPILNSSHYCFGSRPYFQDFVRLTEQMIKRYHDMCHFSFNFITDLTHDRSNNLELLDDYLKTTLARIYDGGFLENTILVIMGDHGNRVNLIRYRYVGRIEERMPLFAVYLPPSFRRRYPEQVRNLRLNQHRLTSHYDSFQMFHDILLGRFKDSSGRPAVDGGKDQWSEMRKGVSLFSPISAKRTCRQANVPENHCTCMVKAQASSVPWRKPDPKLLRWSSDVISKWMKRHCDGSAYSIRVRDIVLLTTNQYVQQGVRHLVEDNATVAQMKTKKKKTEIEYLDVTYEVWNKRSLDKGPVVAVIRLQHDWKLRTLIVNVEPWVLSGPSRCNEDAHKQGCVCMFDCVLYCDTCCF